MIINILLREFYIMKEFKDTCKPKGIAAFGYVSFISNLSVNHYFSLTLRRRALRV
jgi:hypothetical protein